MPFALDGHRGETIIESRGIAHRIVFAADQIRQEPKIEHCTIPNQIVKNGTCVTVRWPDAASVYLGASRSRFLQMAAEYVFLNPHLTLRLYWNDERLIEMSASAPNWQKWRACDPTCAHWYDPARLARYAAALVNHDQAYARERTIREFLGEFRGLSGSAKQKQVLAANNMARMPLAALFHDGAADMERVEALLAAMRRHTRPINPKDLGVIGSEHWRDCCAALNTADDSFRYRCLAGEDEHGVPYVVEAAFAARLERPRGIVAGVNFSASLGNPFRTFKYEYEGLETLLAEQRCGRYEPIAFILHLTRPGIGFRDRGKTSLVLSEEIITSITAAVETVTGAWAKRRKAEERDRRLALRALERREKAAAAKPERAKNSVVGTGILHREIEAAAAASRRSIKDLTVLSPQNDPYRLDTTAGHELGKWLADQIARLVEPQGRVHLRGLFYRIVAAGDVRKPDGEVFANTHENWIWLTTRAAKAARWLSYVSFNRIRDERNEAPRVFLPSSPPHAGDRTFACGAGVDIPALGALLPHLSVIAPRGAQPYRIIFIGEKSSLLDVLGPIAELVNGELLLPTGEATETMIAEMAERAAADGRPAVVLYFSDFDPSGWQMPLSVCRKLQGLQTLLYPEMRIEVHRVALTLDQVRQFDLPSTPLKETEKRASRWREVMQHEQTEIDALAALRPADLRQIARAAVEPFYDFTLDARCAAAGEAWRAEAEARIANHPALATMRDNIAAAHAAVKAAIDTLHEVRYDAHAELKDQLGIDDVTIPAPEVQIEATASAAVFTTADDFATSSLKLIAEKKYEGVEAEDEGA